MDWMVLIYAVGIIQAFILAGILVFTPSEHRQANVFMAGLVATISLVLVQSWLIRSGYFLQNPKGWMVFPSLHFALGPLLYLYAYNLIKGSVVRQQSLHFLPMVLLFIATSSTFWSAATEEQREFLHYFWSDRSDPAVKAQVYAKVHVFWQVWMEWHIQGNLFVLHFGTYCFLVLGLIKQHNQRIQQEYSNLERINLRWLQVLTICCITFFILYLLLNRTRVMLEGYFNSEAIVPSAPFLLLVGLVYVIGIAAIFQPSLIRGNTNKQDTENTTNEPAQEIESPSIEKPEPVKYKHSSLTFDDAETYKQLLIDKMESEKYYLDCDLTLAELAGHMGMTTHQVSQVLNDNIGKNFFNFVSDFRIAHAKELMQASDSRDMPIVELAIEVGFKSKSSFYSAFKKITDMTPTQYKKSL